MIFFFCIWEKASRLVRLICVVINFLFKDIGKKFIK
jgi:hypothetical protein